MKFTFQYLKKIIIIILCLFRLKNKFMSEIGYRDRLSNLNDLIQEFNNVLNWFKELNIRTDIGRIAAYQHYFTNLVDDPINESVPSITRANIHRELFELIWIYKNFVGEKSDKIRDYVKKTLKGVVASNLDSTKDQSSRNYLFELRVASYFLNCGYEINLDTDCDLIAIKNDEKFFVECKRITSYDKIGERIKEAFKQLEKRLESDNSDKKYAIIWIDISFVQCNYTGFYSSYYRMTAQAAARLDLKILQEETVPKLKSNKRIMGIVYQTLYPGVSEVPRGMYTGSTISYKSITSSCFFRRKFVKTFEFLMQNIK